jgi:hypothetical protein
MEVIRTEAQVEQMTGDAPSRTLRFGAALLAVESCSPAQKVLVLDILGQDPYAVVVQAIEPQWTLQSLMESLDLECISGASVRPRQS